MPLRPVLASLSSIFLSRVLLLFPFFFLLLSFPFVSSLSLSSLPVTFDFFQGFSPVSRRSRRGKTQRNAVKVHAKGNEFEAHYRSSLPDTPRGAAGCELKSLCACSLVPFLLFLLSIFLPDFFSLLLNHISLSLSLSRLVSLRFQGGSRDKFLVNLL